MHNLMTEIAESSGNVFSDLGFEPAEATIDQLYQRYLSGDLTLRGMARQLGLSYRELYELFEERDLSF